MNQFFPRGKAISPLFSIKPSTNDTYSINQYYLFLGVIGAENQTLTFMVGGAESTMKRVEKVLLSMGKRAVHCGDVGSGQAAKICNNMLLAISMIGTSECLNLGIK